jgi:hypothetical protein
MNILVEHMDGEPLIQSTVDVVPRVGELVTLVSKKRGKGTYYVHTVRYEFGASFRAILTVDDWREA